MGHPRELAVRNYGTENQQVRLVKREAVNIGSLEVTDDRLMTFIIRTAPMLTMSVVLPCTFNEYGEYSAILDDETFEVLEGLTVD